MNALTVFGTPKPLHLTALLAALTLPALVAPSVLAAPDDFPLGQSEGAVCYATSDDEDPAVQVPGAEAWDIHCRGFEGIWGHLYYFRSSGDSATAAGSVWAKELEKRAKCAAMKPASVQGLENVYMAACQLPHGTSTYSVYRARLGDGVAVAEGFDRISTLALEGLRIETGVAQPPAELDAISGAPRSGTSKSLMDVATDVAQSAAPDFLLERAQLANGRWGFEDCLSSAVSAQQQADAPADLKTKAEFALALCRSDEGQFAKADKDIDRANSMLLALGGANPLLEVYGQNVQAQHLLNQRKWSEARTAADRSISDLNTFETSKGRAISQSIQLSQNGPISDELSIALNSGELSPLFSRVNDDQRVLVYRSQAEYVIGSASAEQGQAVEARRYLSEARSKLEESHLTEPSLQADIGSSLSRLDLQEGRPSDAIHDASLAAAALTNGPDYRASTHEARVYLALANAEAVAQKFEVALDHYAKAFDLFRESRGFVGDSAALSDGYFKLLVSRAGADPTRAEEWNAQFFDAAQSILTTAAAESVRRFAERAGESDDAAAGKARDLQDIERRMTVISAQLRNDQDAKNTAAVADDTKKLDDLNEQKTDLQASLLNTKYGELADTTSPISLKQLQGVLRSDEIYVKTVLLPASGYAIAVGRTWAKIYPIPLSRESARIAVAQLRKPMDETSNYMHDFDVEASHKLYEAIFGPVQNEVTHARSVVYEPDGDLVSLPAGLFVTDDASVNAFNSARAAFQSGKTDINIYQSTAWLARDTDISLSVSPRAFLMMREFAPSKASRMFAGFGGPDLSGISDPQSFRLPRANNEDAEACENFRTKLASGLRPLNGASDLVERIGGKLGAASDDLVLNSAFTIESVERANLQDHRVVFFATHGLAPQENECGSQAALVTSDGLLDEAAIVPLHLNADLVVLSACNTAAGSTAANKMGLQQGSGEELSGLARDFLFAGTRGLVVSQWEVNSSQMLKLMDQFFEPGAPNEAAAVRRAEVAFMNDPTYAHPYYWAAFSLIADGEKPMPIQ